MSRANQPGPLSATVDSLRVWAETDIDKVLKAQKQYATGVRWKAA
jgi:hypothetical protein